MINRPIKKSAVPAGYNDCERFFENSTRTRLRPSFAEKRLSADTTFLPQEAQEKGRRCWTRSIISWRWKVDTIVMRIAALVRLIIFPAHSCEYCQCWRRYAHPTQADAFSMRERLGDLAGRRYRQYLRYYAFAGGLVQYFPPAVWAEVCGPSTLIPKYMVELSA